jgi:hypothetical protein
MNNQRISNEDKADYLRNQRKLKQGNREPSTYHKLADLDDDLGGRYAVEAGEQAATKYPKQDSASPWSGGGAQVPDEMPLGYAIDEQEPVGTPAEIEQALSELALSDRVRSASAGEDNAAHLDVSDNGAISPLQQTGSAGLPSDTSSPSAERREVHSNPAPSSTEVDALPASKSRAGVRAPSVDPPPTKLKRRMNGNGKVVPIANEDEEGWPEELGAEFFLRMEMLGELIEYCREIKRPNDLGMLLKVQQEIWMLTELYFLGLGPRAQEAEAERIAPQWRKLNELMDSNREKAKLLAQRQRRAN